LRIEGCDELRRAPVSEIGFDFREERADDDGEAATSNVVDE
jgi:hypothetical protein